MYIQLFQLFVCRPCCVLNSFLSCLFVVVFFCIVLFCFVLYFSVSIFGAGRQTYFFICELCRQTEDGGVYVLYDGTFFFSLSKLDNNSCVMLPFKRQ